ncbi:MAG: hypothetical protein RSE91_00885 [Bacilli bacterium]
MVEMIDFIFKYWIQIIFGFLISLLSLGLKRVAKYKKKFDNMQVGIQVILKTKIMELYDRLIVKDCITLHEKELLLDLYHTYKNLDGNSFIDSLIVDIDEIPTKSECYKEPKSV